jgi:hypothetical protein
VRLAGRQASNRARVRDINVVPQVEERVLRGQFADDVGRRFLWQKKTNLARMFPAVVCCWLLVTENEGGGVQVGVYRGRIGASVDQRDVVAGEERFCVDRVCDRVAVDRPMGSTGWRTRSVARRFPGLGLDSQLASRGLACWDPAAEWEMLVSFPP